MFYILKQKAFQILFAVQIDRELERIVSLPSNQFPLCVQKEKLQLTKLMPQN